MTGGSNSNPRSLIAGLVLVTGAGAQERAADRHLFDTPNDGGRQPEPDLAAHPPGKSLPRLIIYKYAVPQGRDLLQGPKPIRPPLLHPIPRSPCHPSY